MRPYLHGRENRTPFLNSWFWISLLFFGQGICSIGFARIIKLPLESLLMPIMVLFLGGFAGIIFWRLNLGSGRENKSQWAVVVFLYALFIFLMSSRSYPGAEMNFDASYFHPLEYLTLGLLLGRFWYSVLETRGFVSFAARVMAAGAVLAAFDEIHQAFVPGRYPDPKDFALDLCGLFGSILIVVAIRRVIGPTRANSRVSK